MIQPTTYQSTGSSTIPYIPYVHGYLFGVSGDAYAQRAVVKIEVESGEEMKIVQGGMIKREEATLHIKKVLGITGELFWACLPVWNKPVDYDHTSILTGSHYLILDAAYPGTYHITIPTVTDENDASTESTLLNGIKLSIEVPAAGIYMSDTPYEFTGNEMVFGIRPYSKGPMDNYSNLFGTTSESQYKQVPAIPGEYTDEGLYIVKIANNQAISKDVNNMLTDVQIYGKAPTGATTIYFSPYDGNLDKESLSASVITSTSNIRANGLFWHVKNDINSTGVINPTHESGYCGVIWCEAPAGGEFFAQATVHFSCLSGDTLITMADGTKCRLDVITLEDYALSCDNTPTKVIKLERGNFNKCHILYHFDDGTTIDETHEHRFFHVEHNTLVKLKDWKIGERAKKQDGSTVSLESIEVVKEPAEMFGIWTESGYYFANGLLSGEAVAAAKEPLSGNDLVEFIGSIPTGELHNLIGESGWFE